MTQPKISIIIPVYNMEKYLRECLDSVLKQTLQEIEIICINDGSKDKSLKIMEHYAAQYSNIRIIDQPNMGVGNARNTGIAFSKGEFIAFMDPDDCYLTNDTLEKMYLAAKANDVKICGGSFSEVCDGVINTQFKGIYTKYIFAENSLMEYTDYQFDYGYHRFIYDRKMLLENKIFFPTYVRFQDPPFFVKAMITAQKFYALKMPTYCYRVGHQKIEWNETKTADLMRGLIDNLRISRKNGLVNLHRLTVWRLVKESPKKIISNLDSDVILGLLLEANSEICSEYISEDEGLKKQVMPMLRIYMSEINPGKINYCEVKQNDISTETNMYYVWRKIKGGIQCYKDHGLQYTAKHFMKKCKNKINYLKGKKHE